MKNLILALIIWAISMTAAVYGQTLEVVFYFPVSSATLSIEQTDSIETIMKSGFEPVSVVGYANTYSNLTTDETNESLARRRSEVFGAPVTTSHVVLAGEAEMRKVVITFAVSTLSVSTDVQLSSDNVRQEESGTVSNDNIETADLSANNAVSPNNSFASVSSEISDSAARVAYLDSLYANASEYEKAAWAISVTPTSQDDAKSCGCGVNQSLEQTWKLYESLQDSASVNVHINNNLSKEYTCQATQVRICWESMYKAFKQQTKEQASSKVSGKKVDETKAPARAKVKSTAYRQSGKSHKSARLNDNLLSKLFPFRGC
jgi:DNA polymerase III gamma/tau subunit